MNNQVFFKMSENSHGGARQGAGRKSKVEEATIAEQMDAVLDPANVWNALANKVEENDVQAIKTWLGYRYGMPTQKVEQKNIGEVTQITLVDARAEN